MPKSDSRMLFKLSVCVFFFVSFMMHFIIVLNFEIHSIKMRSSKPINYESNVQEKMTRFGFRHEFYDLK